MIRRVKVFLGLSWQEQRLFIEVVCLTAIVRLAILLLPFRILAPILGKHMQESPMQEGDIKMKAAQRIGRIVMTVSQYTPWKSKCLVQAITGKIMLRRHGVANTLYLGVGRDQGRFLVAHAWLRCGEEIITGGQGRDVFTIVAKFSDDGGSNYSVERRCDNERMVSTGNHRA